MIDKPLECVLIVLYRIYYTLGQAIRCLIDTVLSAGENSIIWDGRNNGVKLVSSGIYYMRLQAGEFSDLKRMTFVT